jgi:carbamoyltransferase
MKILLIPLVAHDTSVCVIDDGKIIHYQMEERFSREKHDKKFINILNNLKGEHFERVIVAHSFIFVMSLQKLGERLEGISFDELVIKTGVHHVFHAYSGFYNSGFDEAICLSVDGTGALLNNSNVELETVYLLRKNHKERILHQRTKRAKITRKENDTFWNTSPFSDENLSMGDLFALCSQDFGFDVHAAGKVMGLAQYKNYKDKLQHPYDSEEWKQRVNTSYLIQQSTQKHVLNLIEEQIDQTGIKNIVISGGYGLNCVANYYYLKNLKDINLYIDPICFDAGISIGSAYYHYLNSNRKEFKLKRLENVYIGYKEESYNLTGLESKKVSYDDIVDLLLKQNIVALFQGRSEAGQRALGNRSLLFDPRNPKGKDIVNKIKKRENFRPFAGTILQEEAHKWFNMLSLEESPYMQYAMDAYNIAIEKVPAIIHSDNTCRIQTLTRQQNQHFYNLISCFFEKTGVPMLMNTSFNLGGEPLVETFEHAIDTLTRSDIDYLYLPEIETLVSIPTHLHY